MAKRKYTRSGDTPVAYQCSNKKCNWQGTDDEKSRTRSRKHLHEYTLVCPVCKGDTFYGLLDLPKKTAT